MVALYLRAIIDTVQRCLRGRVGCPARFRVHFA